MNDRTVGVIAGLLGLIGMGLHYGMALLRTDLRSETIPHWAVYGTVGQSVTTYVVLIEAIIAGSVLLLAIGAGYYIGKHSDVASEAQSLLINVAGGSTLGVVIGAVAMQWSSIQSIGSPVVYGSQGREMFIMDIVLLLAVGLQVLAEVAFVITVGVIAGAAFTYFRRRDSSDSSSTPTDTDGPSSGNKTRDDGVETNANHAD